MVTLNVMKDRRHVEQPRLHLPAPPPPRAEKPEKTDNEESDAPRGATWVDFFV